MVGRDPLGFARGRFFDCVGLALGRKTNPRSRCKSKKSSRPTVPCGGPRMNPSLDDGSPPRPFRHLRMAEHRSPDPSSSQAPVHSVLVQKSVTAITNPVGRLSDWMLGKRWAMRKGEGQKRWHRACNQSNGMQPFVACNRACNLGRVVQRTRFPDLRIMLVCFL